jgi:hypothetical protein
VCVGLLAGCGSDKGSIGKAELSRLVLQPADVPAYAQFDEGRQTKLDALPGPRKDTARFGREGGWKARYRRSALDGRGPSVVESRADLFGDVSGAKHDLAAYRKQLETPIPGSGATTRVLGTPRVGDDAVAVEIRQGPAVFFTIAWRTSNATASLTAQGQAKTTSYADALGLAQRQARRLQRAAKP